MVGWRWYDWNILILILIFPSWFTLCTPLFHPDDQSWNTVIVDTSILKYKSDSPAEKDIEELKSLHQQAYKQIQTTLAISFTAPIFFYIFNEAADADFETDELGQVYPSNLTVELLYKEHTSLENYYDVLLHEVAHVMFELGVGSSGLVFFVEGAAVALSNEDTVPFFPEVLYQFPLYDLITMDMDNFYASEYRTLHYAIAGSFSQYLIQEYGIETFKQCYVHCKGHNFMTEFSRIFGVNFMIVASEWEQTLSVGTNL
jgi:hypothetical protein